MKVSWCKRLFSFFMCIVIAALLPMGCFAQTQGGSGEVTLEMESMTPITKTGSTAEVRSATGFSGGKFFFMQGYATSSPSNTLPDLWANFTMTVPAAGTYDLYLTSKDNPDRGIFSVSIDSKVIGSIDCYNTDAAGVFVEHYIGKATFSTTTAILRIQATGSNASASAKYGIAADCVRLVPSTSLTPVQYEGENLTVTGTDGIGSLNGPLTLAGASGNMAYRFQPKSDAGYEDGKYVEFSFPTPSAGTYDLVIATKTYKDRGRYQVAVNGADIGILDGYAVTASFVDIKIGSVTFGPGAPATSTIRFTGAGRNSAILTDAECTHSMILDVLKLQEPQAEPPASQDVILGVNDSTYTELSGTWTNGANSGYESGATRISSSTDCSAGWYTYPPDTQINQSQNFIVSVWIPASTETGKIRCTVNTLNGTWIKEVDRASTGQWAAVATVSAIGGTALNTTLSVSQGAVCAANVKLQKTANPADPVTPAGGGSDATGTYVFVNQLGYDTDKPKRATIVNIADGTPFSVKNAASHTEVFTGTVQQGIADFTALQPGTKTDYYIECSGAVSYNFSIGKYLIQKESVLPALNFMSQSRQDTFELGGKTGYGWRDSHQFSFELNSLVLQYMANPSLYEHLPHQIYKPETCEYPELQVQDEPDIVWLMEFGAYRYYDLAKNQGVKLHMLIKEQLAYFLYLYPQIKQYVPEAMYLKIRDLTIQEWGNPDCNKSWYAVDGENQDLFSTQTVIGGIKGALPPAHSIVPNLMMYEVIRRDGLGDGQNYFNAAYNNCQWLIENKDITDTYLSKGQRMSEYIVMENLAYFQEMYPERAPKKLLSEIDRWADKMIARANNEWDLRMASSVAAGDSADFWTGSGWAYSNGYSTSLMNEPGNESGVQAITFAACRVLKDSTKINRLREIGNSAIDDMFGRNPYGRAFFYNVKTEFEGGDLGWFDYYKGGFGALAPCVGRIDASPKESSYPFNPNADKGYTEGWVAFNTAWNSSLAYSAANDVNLNVSASTAKPGDNVHITLKAPLNMDYNAIETADIVVKDTYTGKESKFNLTEDGKDSYTFSGDFTLPDTTTVLEISYGYGLFRQSKQIAVIGDGFVPVTKITLNKTELSIEKGKTGALAVASILPYNATISHVQWSSSNTDVATVDENGVVTAIGMGNAVITARSDSNPEVTAQCPITVTAPAASAIRVAIDNNKIKPYDTAKLSVTELIMSDGSTNPFSGTLTYVPENRDIVSVNADGEVLGKRAGSTKITVSTEIDGKTLSGNVLITVLASSEMPVKTEFSKEISTSSNPEVVGYATTGGGFSGTGVTIFKPTAAPAWVEFSLPQTTSGKYLLRLTAKRYTSYGVYQVLVDNKALGDPIDFSQGAVGSYPVVEFGGVQLEEGVHKVKFELVRAGSGGKFDLAPDFVELVEQYPQYPPAANRSALTHELTVCQDLLQNAAAGDHNGQYPQDMLDAFEQTILSAQSVSEMDEPTQSILDLGFNSLLLGKNAFLRSVIVVSTDKLADTVNNANAILKKLSDYLQEGQSEFLAALESAKNQLSSPGNQAEVDSATMRLNTAFAALKLIPPSKPPVPPSSDSSSGQPQSSAPNTSSPGNSSEGNSDPHSPLTGENPPVVPVLFTAVSLITLLVFTKRRKRTTI